MKPVAALVLGALAARAVPARAADEAAPEIPRLWNGTPTRIEVPPPDEPIRTAVLPPSLFVTKKDFWVVGIGVERFATRNDDLSSLDHFLAGVTTMWRLGPFAPHALLMMHPSREHENLRLLGGLGFRGYLDIPGFTELSVGIGTHAEARLEDHFWLWYLTPLEVGGVVVENSSFELEVFLGVRRALSGHLINHFLVDPNGFDSQTARDNLDRETGADAWKGFVRVVFARRLD